MGSLRNLTIAFVTAVAAGVVIFYFFSVVLGLSESVAQGAAALPLTALPKAYEELEKSSSKRLSNNGNSVKSFENFSIPWPMLLIYSSLLFFGVTNLSMLFALITFNLSPVTPVKPHAGTIGLMALPVMTVGLFFAGRWVGSRAPRYGIIIAVVALIISFISGLAVDLSVGGEPFREFYETEPFSVDFFSRVMTLGILGLFIKAVPVVFGYWRGRKAALSKYLAYLLEVMPESSRETLIKLAMEEAQTSQAAA